MMEQSAPCTPDNLFLSTMSNRDINEKISDSQVETANASEGTPTSYTDEAPSPLGQLDPHRLRDMVVDKQITVCQNQTESSYKMYWTPSPATLPTPSPSNTRGTPADSASPVMPPSRLSQGSSTPHSTRDSSVMSPNSSRCSTQIGAVCITGQSPLNSPVNMHPPPSPFITRPPPNSPSPSMFVGRPNSNASPSPYMQPQTSTHYVVNMQQLPQNSNPSIMQSGQIQAVQSAGNYTPRISSVNLSQTQYAYHPTQPQWNSQSQTHYVNQPQMMNNAMPSQRIMVQRVPYPGAGYQQNLAQAPSPSSIAYPSGGGVATGAAVAVTATAVSATNCTTAVATNAASVHSQGAIRGAGVYGSGGPSPASLQQQQQTATPPLAAVAQQQAVTTQFNATSGAPPNVPPSYPAAFYQKGQPSYPQTQIYRTQNAAPVSVRAAFLSNQQQQIAPGNVYPMYPNSANATSGVAPQSQQYTSSTTRYPVPVQNTAAGISPCYPPAGHDMRSPQLMSPTQGGVASGAQQGGPQAMMAPVVAAGAAQNANANGAPIIAASNVQANAASAAVAIQRTIDIQQGNTGPVQVPQHVHMPVQYYGHEPSIPVSSDFCLIGCFFVVIEHDRILIDRLDVHDIGVVVRLHGGEIEFGPRAYNSSNCERVTHIVCESVRHHLVQQALKDRKRCVTLQWLNDVVAKKRLEPPWKVSHLPSCWAENLRPAAGKIIAINDFDENERSGIKLMINAIGGRFTPYLTKHNHFLIAKSGEGEKVEQCREMGISVVSYQWLVDLYLGIKNVVNEGENAYFPSPNIMCDVNISPYALEHFSDLCKQLLAPWRAPIMFSNEQWQRMMEVKRSIENDESVYPNKKLRSLTPPPTDDMINEHINKIGTLESPPVVCFSGFTPEEKDALSRKMRYLGGRITDSVAECTHLVVFNLWRTLKLLEAVALGKNVIGPNWITDGYKCNIIPDTLDYFVHDEENEKNFGYNLKYSILRARHKRLFDGVTFYLTPSVEPSYDELAKLIKLAGGKVLPDTPQPQYVARCIETESPIFVISNDCDVHLLQYLTDCGFPIFNAEIVLTGILRQKIENSTLYRVNPYRASSIHHQPPQQNIAARPVSVAAQRLTV